MSGETLNVDKVPTPVEAVDLRTLNWYAEKCSNQKLKGIAQRELARRAGGAPAAPSPRPRPTQALARQQDAGALAIEGNFRDPVKATAALKAAGEAYHLISPATMVGALPEGCAVALALVHINPSDPNLYKVGNKLALDRTHLAQIGNAAGVSIVESHRTDDGSDPHYCAWTARARYRQFDGTWATKPGSVEQDLREPFGAEYVDAIEKAADASPPRDPRKQIRELRRFITRHAESKAINRAYAAVGVRRAYTREELAKPFAVARVVFTGQSDDPEARKQFRDGIMRSFLSSSDEAFGPGPERAEAPMMQLAAPPPPMQDYSQPPTYDAEGEDADDEPDDEPPPHQTGSVQPDNAGAAGAVNPESY